MAHGRAGTPSLVTCLALVCLAQPQSCTLQRQADGQAIQRRPPAPACPHVPPPRAAKPPLPPPSGFPQYLQPGHWEWNEGNYAWQPPQWHTRFTPSPPSWRDGYWEANGGACVWHNGHFRAPGEKPISGQQS